MTTETLPFQAEVQQLLHIVSHALYSQRDVFLRELLSNASDACEKLRYEALHDSRLLTGTLAIDVRFNKDAKTLTVSDNGIGMNRDEVISHLGVIARSGTREFMAALKQRPAENDGAAPTRNGDAATAGNGDVAPSQNGDVAPRQATTQSLIGQFGVGFYSSFIVADKVEVLTRRAGTESAVRWTSDGTGSFTVEDATRDGHGLDVVLHLKKEHQDLLDAQPLKEIIQRYSDHILQPVRLQDADGDISQVNQGAALWAKSKNDISEAQYQEFYKHIAHDFQDPLAWSHARIEGRMPHIELLYLPPRLATEVREGHQAHGLKLYVRRVFVLEDHRRLLPGYLRFVRGIVDVEDMPLNISREILQESRDVDALRASCTRRILGLLEDLAKDKAEVFQKFWNTFGQVFKEGIVEDEDQRERIAALLRFHSTHESSRNATQAQVSLDEYLGRMKPEQNAIYYLSADDLEVARNNPQLESLTSQGIEVLLLTDRIDEWVVAHLLEFRSKPLQSVTRGALPNAAAPTAPTAADEGLLAKLKTELGEKVAAVRASTRLVSSPCCLVDNEQGMSRHLAEILQATGQRIVPPAPVLEVNLTHPLIQRLEELSSATQLTDWAHWLLDQAVLAEGGRLEHPAETVRRLNQLLLQRAP